MLALISIGPGSIKQVRILTPLPGSFHDPAILGHMQGEGEHDTSHMQANVATWLITGWLSESLWQLLFALETRISLVLCAMVLIFGAFAFIRAMLACRSFIGPKVGRFLLVTSTAINAAWLTVAASLGILVALSAISVTTLTPVAAVLAVVVAVIGVGVTLQESSAAYSLTLLWTFWGVHMKNADGQLVDALALGCSALFAALCTFVLIKNVVGKKQTVSGDDGETLLQPAAGEGQNVRA